MIVHYNGNKQDFFIPHTVSAKIIGRVGRFSWTEINLSKAFVINISTCGMETADSRHFLKLDNIFIHSTGGFLFFVKLSLRQMIESVSQINDGC